MYEFIVWTLSMQYISDLSGRFDFKAISLENGFTALCKKNLFAFIGHVHAQVTIENHNSADCTYSFYIPLFH
jgi:hypothetical protein